MREAVSSRNARGENRSRQGEYAVARADETLNPPSTRELLARLGLAWLLTLGVGLSATWASALVGH